MFFMKKLTLIITMMLVVFVGSNKPLLLNAEETYDSLTGTQDEITDETASADFSSKDIHFSCSDMISYGEDYCIEVNPLYADIYDVDDIEHFIEADSLDNPKSYNAISKGQTYAETTDGFSDYIREKLINRETDLTLYYYSYNSIDSISVMKSLLQEALAHTGIGTEGDYLSYNYAGVGYSSPFSYNGATNTDFYYSFNFTFAYYTNATQEAELTAEVNRVMESFGFNGDTTEYEKTSAIYNYITNHVSYDYENLENNEYKLKFSAYAAMMNGTAVCQGYATLLYRMLNEAGIDCRVITGTGNGGNHAWNIAKLNDVYYLMDSTWDAGQNPVRYSWFLKGSSHFSNHSAESKFRTSEFTSSYPISTENYDTGVSEEPEQMTLVQTGPKTIEINAPSSGHYERYPVLLNLSCPFATVKITYPDRSIVWVQSADGVISFTVNQCGTYIVQEMAGSPLNPIIVMGVDYSVAVSELVNGYQFQIENSNGINVGTLIFSEQN